MHLRQQQLRKAGAEEGDNGEEVNSSKEADCKKAAVAKTSTENKSVEKDDEIMAEKYE